MMGIAAMGFSLGRNNVFNITPSSLHHNFYILLVGPSSLSHKSTTVDDIWFEVIDQNYKSPFHFSPPSFYEHLSENPQTVLYFDEFGSVIKKMARRGGNMAEFLDNLNTFYKCPAGPLQIRLKSYKHKTENPTGTLYLNNLYMSVIGCTTEEALEENLTTEMLEGGFFPRFLIILTKFGTWYPSRKKSDTELKEERALIEHMQRYLDRLSDINFDFIWSTEAWNALGNFMVHNINRIQNNGGGHLGTGSVYARAEQHIQKIANIYALNETKLPKSYPRGKRFNIHVKREYIEKAIRFVHQSIKDSIKIKDQVASHLIVKLLNKHIGRMHGPTRHSKLLRYTRLPAEDFAKGIDTFIQRWDIIKFRYNNHIYYCTAKLKKECNECQMRQECGIDVVIMKKVELKRQEIKQLQIRNRVNNADIVKIDVDEEEEEEEEEDKIIEKREEKVEGKSKQTSKKKKKKVVKNIFKKGKLV